jgi:hypothetical protein
MKTCPICRQENPAANSYCGNCGADLNETALIVKKPTTIQIGEKPLATPQAKALVVTLAVGAVTLLAEAGLTYLQHRVEGLERPSFSLRKLKKPAAEKALIMPPSKRPPDRVITVVGERVIEEKRWGRPVRRIVERMAWRGEERSNS